MAIRLIVSALVFNDKGELLLQKRYKPKASPAYLDVWEIPAGGVDEDEDVMDAVKREVLEETGLKVEVTCDSHDIYEDEKKDVVQVFKPFICQQMLKTKHGLGWVGYVFICNVTGGNLKSQLSEAKDPTWVTMSELKKMLEEPNIFFSLQVPVLQKLIKREY